MADVQGQPLTTMQQIQNALAQKRTEIGQRYASLPQTEANLRASLYGGDQTLGSLRENEAAKIKELYNHDQQVASTYQPTSPGFIEDPASKAKYGSMILGNTGGELADIQKGIANRRDVLGDALEKGMKMAMYGLEALKQEYGGLESERDFMQKQKEHEDEIALRREEMSNGSTSTERALNEAKSRIQREAQQGVTFDELYMRYIDEVPESIIREIYNTVNYYKKPAKETSADLKQRKSLAEKPVTLTADQKKQAGFSKASLDAVDNYESNADNFKNTNPYSGNYTKLMENLAPDTVDQGLMKLNSRIGPIRENVINVISGAQVSAEESKRVMSWIPDIAKSPQKNREDLISLREWLKGRYLAATGDEYVPTKPKAEQKKNGANNNDPLGLFK